MTTINLDGVAITMVDNWNEVTLRQFIDFMIWNESKPTEFTYNYEELLYGLDLISVFTSPRITSKEIDKINITSIKSLVDQFQAFSVDQPSFTPSESLTINGVLYSFANPEKLPIGEYVSYQKLLETSNNKIKAIPDLLSIICRPVSSHKYDQELKKNVYTLEEFDTSKLQIRRELLLDVPAIELMGNVNFFLTGSRELMSNSQDFGSPSPEVTEI
jgi:hypothetical protein